MTRLTHILILVVLAVAMQGGPVEGAASSERGRPSSGSGFDAFKVVLERNIFDSSRRPGQPRRSSKAREHDRRPAPVLEERISLIGAFINRGRDGTEAVAFFTGSNPENNISAKPGDTVAGYRVAEIHTDRVRLVKEGRHIDLPIGMALGRRGEGEWKVVSAPPPQSPSATIAESRKEGPSKTASAQATESGKPGGGSTDDILRKLMERRRKERGQ